MLPGVGGMTGRCCSLNLICHYGWVINLTGASPCVCYFLANNPKSLSASFITIGQPRPALIFLLYSLCVFLGSLRYSFKPILTPSAHRNTRIQREKLLTKFNLDVNGFPKHSCVRPVSLPSCESGQPGIVMGDWRADAWRKSCEPRNVDQPAHTEIPTVLWKNICPFTDFFLFRFLDIIIRCFRSSK